MSQTASQSQDLETGNVGGTLITGYPLFLPCLPSWIGDDYSEQPRSAPNLTPEREFLPDGSGPLFSMYTRIGEEKDDKIVELWQKDADGILIFVSHHVEYIATPTNCGNFRLDYSLRLSLPSLRCPYKT
jgi:hypothetical protein